MLLVLPLQQQQQPLLQVAAGCWQKAVADRADSDASVNELITVRVLAVVML